MSKLMLLARGLLIVSLATATGGCGYLFGDKGVFRDKSEDYRLARMEPRLDLPPGKDDAALVDIYVIPPVQEELLFAGEFEVPRPSPLVAGAGAEVVRIQSLGDESWALMNLAPGQLWPQVRGFLSVTGLALARQDARLGILETDWALLEGQDMNSRFRFRIEQGVQRGTSELHILQMDQAGDVDGWPDLSDDSQQEKEMLRAVAQYVANSADSATVSMIAEQAISSEGKLAMVEGDDGHSYIRLGLPYDRAWASLSKAIENSGFEVTDRDRSAGTYYVTYEGNAEEDKGGGWFGWLFGGKDKNPVVGLPLVVSISRENAQRVNIRLAPESGRPLEKRDEQNLLSVIKGNIN